MTDKHPGAIAALGKAVPGAIAWVILTTFVIVLLSCLGVDGLVTPAGGMRRFIVAIGVGAVVGAVFGTAFGAREIRGRAGMVIQGMAWGAVVGIPVGAVIDPIVVSILVGKLAAAKTTLGIFWGGPLGALVGGVIGATYRTTPTKKEPSPCSDGVRDRELDG